MAGNSLSFFGTKFVRDKFSDIATGKTVVSFREEPPQGYKIRDGEAPFTVKISATEMSFSGTMAKPVVHEHDLQEFALFISEVWKERRALAPKLSSSLSGH